MVNIEEENALTERFKQTLASAQWFEKIPTTFLQKALDTVDRVWHSNNVNTTWRKQQ